MRAAEVGRRGLRCRAVAAAAALAVPCVPRRAAAEPRDGAPAAADYAAVAPAPSDEARYSDAHSDRVLLFPTGETHPQGTFFISDYDLIGVAGGYALTDRFEVELGVVVPFLADAALKLNLLHLGQFRVATVAAMDLPLLNFGPPVFRGGVTAQFCFTRNCWSSLSVTMMAGGGKTDLLPDHYGLVGSAGAIIALSRVVKLLVEPVLTWVPGDSSSSGLQWGAGLRFGRERWALDLGLEVITGETESLPVWPLLAFTWRTAGARPPATK